MRETKDVKLEQVDSFPLSDEEITVYNEVLEEEINPIISGSRFENTKLKGDQLVRSRMGKYSFAAMKKAFEDAKYDYRELIGLSGSRSVEFAGHEILNSDDYALAYTAMLSYYTLLGGRYKDVPIELDGKDIEFGYSYDPSSMDDERMFMKISFPDGNDMESTYQSLLRVREKVRELVQ